MESSLVLAINLNIVVTHVRNIPNNMQGISRTEAAAYAIRRGLQGTQLDLLFPNPPGDDHGIIHDRKKFRRNVEPFRSRSQGHWRYKRHCGC
jgi:hypothetical protein